MTTPRIEPTSPRETASALEAFITFQEVLDAGRLSSRLRAQVALALDEIEGCPRCRRHHFEEAVDLEISAAEIARNRRGGSEEPRVRAALAFARFVATSDGDVLEHDLAAPRRAGFEDDEIAELVAMSALHCLHCSHSSTHDSAP
jgi:alkylhydroperoxidase family enzyme